MFQDYISVPTKRKATILSEEDINSLKELGGGQFQLNRKHGAQAFTSSMRLQDIKAGDAVIAATHLDVYHCPKAQFKYVLDY